MQSKVTPEPLVDIDDWETLRPAGRMVFSVKGMFCASCALAVQRVIQKVPGVLESNVNFTSGAALVRWDPQFFDFKPLLRRIHDLGYELSPLLDSNELRRTLNSQASRIRLQLIIAAFFGMWSMLGSWMLYLDIHAVMGIESLIIGWTASALSLPVILYSGADLYLAGWKTLRAGVPGMDALVSLGVWGSLLLSLLNLLRDSANIYVDAATMLITFQLVGRLIEIQARNHNLVAIEALRQLVPETVTLVQVDGIQLKIPLQSIQTGQSIYVQAGERIAVDGSILSGASQLDASLLTGESLPQSCKAGEQVLAGMVNLSAPLLICVKNTQGHRRIDKLGLRMLELFGTKSSMSKLAEKFARWLLPVVSAISIAAFTRYIWAGLPLDRALLASLSILVAACPCAVGIALPLAFSAGSAKASRSGILFRDPASVEALAHSRHFTFDKTGTLTTGELAVSSVISARLDREALIRVAATAEAGVAHPVAEAIVKHALICEMDDLTSASTIERHASGVRYRAPDGCVWLLGSSEWLRTQGVSGLPVNGREPIEPGAAPGAIIDMACDGIWEGRIELRDRIRDDALVTLQALRNQGCHTELITGDNAHAAQWVGAKLGFESAHIHSACEPEEKVHLLQRNRNITTFVGDGINDTLVLAAANCGVSVQGANAVAVTASDIVITQGGIEKIVQARHFALQIVRRIHQNLFFSICYNVAIVGLFFQMGVTPGIAAVAMLLSSMTVIGNSMRRFAQPTN